MKIDVLITGARSFDAGGNVEAEIGSGFHWRRPLRMRFPGELRQTTAGLVNSVDIETYLECVIASEMNPLAPKEFLKAHAIISRGWALGKVLGRHREDSAGKVTASSLIIGWDDTAQHDRDRDGCHICNDDHCQRYQGFSDDTAAREAAREAVRETEGIVLTAPDGSLIDARFSKCCGGHTELFQTCWQDDVQPCLEAFPDPHCDLSTLTDSDRERLMLTAFRDYDRETGDFYRWERDVPSGLVGSRVRALFGRDLGEIVSLEPLRRGASGRISLLRILGTKGELDLGKELYIRRVLSDTHLLSSAFEIEETAPGVSPSDNTGRNFRLRGRGWGHGVGLCQAGAARMAFDGASAADILRFYYPSSIPKRFPL